MTTNTITQARHHITDQVVARNIRALAGLRGLSGAALARTLGMAQSSLSERWRGERQWQLRELDDVARTLGVSVMQLVDPGLIAGGYSEGPAPVGAGPVARLEGLEPPTF